MKWAARTSTAARRSEEVCEVVLFTAHASCNPLLHGERNANIQCRPILTAEAATGNSSLPCCRYCYELSEAKGSFPLPLCYCVFKTSGKSAGPTAACGTSDVF